MKKLLFIIALVAMAGTAAADSVRKMTARQTAPSAVQAESATALNFEYYVGCYYTAGAPAEYYGILSTAESAKYNAADATMSIPAGEWALYLDFYSDATSPVALPEGTYREADYELIQDYSPFTYDPYYTRAARFDKKGKIDKVYILTGDITVTKSGNTYTVTGRAYCETDKTDIVDISYTGVLPMSNVADTQTAYPQLRHNIDPFDAKQAVGIYYGDIIGNNTGVLQVGLTTAAYDTETGAMQGEGIEINAWLVSSLFKDPANAALVTGTYTIERTAERFSAYPGMEIDYMGIPIVFGSYVRERDTKRYGTEEPSVYGYLTEGTVVVELATGGYHIAVDGVTNLGFTVKADFTGNLSAIIDQHVETGGGAVVSTLEQDVDLDLAYMPRAHVMDHGLINGCRSYVLDIGGDTQYEEAYYWEHYDEGHDAMRIEFLVEPDAQGIDEGTYTVLEDRHNPAYYKPFKLERGYFTAPTEHDNGGYPSGTRYMSFYKYLYMDHLSPAMSGTVGVTRNDDGTYTFSINVQDDGNFFVRGEWTGPLVLHYDPANLNGIGTTDATRPWLIDADNRTLTLGGIDKDTRVSLHALSGAQVFAATGASRIDISSLAPAVYILRMGDTAVKIVKK